MTTWSRLPRAFIHVPSTVSDSPPEWPGAHREYTSAVSMKLPPAAPYASSTASDAVWSVVQPNVLPPRQSAATLRPVRPSLRINIPCPLSIESPAREASGGAPAPGPSPQAASASHVVRHSRPMSCAAAANPGVGVLASRLRSYEAPPQPARGAGVLASGRDGSPRPREHASDAPSVHWTRPMDA